MERSEILDRIYEAKTTNADIRATIRQMMRDEMLIRIESCEPYDTEDGLVVREIGIYLGDELISSCPIT